MTNNKMPDATSHTNDFEEYMAGTAVYVLPNRIVLKMNKFIYSTTRTKLAPKCCHLPDSHKPHFAHN